MNEQAKNIAFNVLKYLAPYTNVTAEYFDGILNLTLPKVEEEKNKVVKVNLEQAA